MQQRPSGELGELHHSLCFPIVLRYFQTQIYVLGPRVFFSMEALCTMGWQQAREKNKTAADLSNSWSKFNGSYRGGCPR